MTNVVAQAACEAIGQDWAPIPIPSRSKIPKDRDGWQNERWKTEDVPEHFPEHKNIGLLLGSASNGLVDCDLDCAEARALAPHFLRETPFVHGRDSAPRSHYWYIADPIPDYIEFRHSDSRPGEPHGTKILELRTGVKLQNNIGQQTVIPPSIHPDGEQLVWEESAGRPDAKPTKISGDELTRSMRALGAAIIAVRHYPKTGDRHAFTLALAGFLLRQSGWDEQRTGHFVVTVAQEARDEEAFERKENVETTVARLVAGGQATGGTRFREIVGNAVFDAFCKALGIAFGSDNKTSNALPLIESDSIEDEIVIEEWPEILEGDYISELAHQLTDATSIPLAYGRETINLVLGAVCDGRIGFPAHHDLPLRRYTILLSQTPQAGKGESWKRVAGTSRDGEALHSLLATAGITVMPGTGVGSGQYLAKILEETPNLIMHWDESSDFFNQTGREFSTLTGAIKTLFESNVYRSGSFTNKSHGSDAAHLSVLMHSTMASFNRGFALVGGAGDGLLSRFVLVPANRNAVPEWRARDFARERSIISKIESLIPTQLTVPEFEPDARPYWQEFALDIEALSQKELTRRIVTLAKVDLLLRTIFSGSRTITRDLTTRAVNWGWRQLALRRALWLPDADDETKAMTRTLLNRLQRGTASARDLRRAANVARNGSHEILHRALTALQRTGEVTIVGKNRKGQPVYGIEADEPKVAT